jgi:hypothetical protein
MRKRGKQKIDNHITIIDGYKEYIKAGNTPISSKDFTAIHKEINDSVLKLIRETNFVYTLPQKMGRLRIKKFKPRVKISPEGELNWKQMRVDYKKTWEYWRGLFPGMSDDQILEQPHEKRPKVYHYNNHSAGYRYKHFWDKSSAYFKGKTAFVFKPVRDVSRALPIFLKSLDALTVDYFE